ncbi:MAG: HEAT repeat domain-containing protein [Planctomycetes bacterium]|jgi:HEAT repeat protein|nr:HEAT repeat domain-containing protein [Planctomycetota bacterium]
MLLRIARGTFVFACALGLVGAVSFLPQPAPLLAQAGDALGLVKEGLREYKAGNYLKAIQKFDEALAKDPSDEEARKIRDEISAELAQRMINNNLSNPELAGRYSRFGKWVLAGRQKGPAMGRNKAPDDIKKYVDEYMGDADVARNLLRGAAIRDAYGDFVVPYLQENYMHSDNQDSRYRARNLLAVIGPQCVNAVIQCMQSSEMYDRQTAALALTDIGDVRALPVLAKHFQDNAEDPKVRDACAKGVEILRRGLAEQDKKVNNAKDLFYLQAESYYRNNAAGRYYRNRLVGASYPGNLPVVMYGFDRSYTVWRWYKDDSGERLVDKEVPLWAFADLLAEESAVMALELGVKQAGGNQNDAWVQDCEALLACIRFHLASEAVDRWYNGSPEERQFINGLMAEQGIVPSMMGFGLGASAGSPRLYAALERSLADGYPEVSIAICDALAELDDKNAIGTNVAAPLIRALTDPDKRIRYAAARSLVRLGAKKDFGNNAMVEQTLTRNLQETAARSVLVISEDEALRNQYLSDLESLGISATGANSLEQGADLATQAPVYDAIIVQGSLILAPTFTWEPPQLPGRDRAGEQRMETLFDILSKDVRTRLIPLLVASLDSESEGRKSALAGRGLQDSQFITYSSEYKTDPTALGDTLKSLWDMNPESAKSRANRLVADMGRALMTLDPAATKYNVEKLLAALSGGLRLPGRDWEARASICDAIAVLVKDSNRVGANWVRTNLVPNLVDTINSTDRVDAPLVKAAAARALGACYQYHRGSFDEDGFKALLALVRLEHDLDSIGDENTRMRAIAEVNAARNAAGDALGRAPTTQAQRALIARAQMIVPHAKPPAIPKSE